MQPCAPVPRALLGAAWTCGLLIAGLAQASSPRIVVVKSADHAAYGAVVAGFSAEVRSPVEEVTLSREGEDGERERAELFRGLAERPPDLVLAVGPLAANAARRALPGVPMVFCMVPQHERYALEGPKVTGVGLTSDLAVELDLLAAMFPGARRIGLLHDPRWSARALERARELTSERGLTLVPLETERAAEAAAVLSRAKGKVDALMMVADRTVATPYVTHALLRHARSERLPLIALSPTQVREGALLSLSPSPVAVGAQAGRLASRIVHERVDPGALAVAPPEGLELSLNLTQARALGTDGELLYEVLRFAARRSYSLRAFE